MDYMAAVVDGKLGKPEYRGKFNLPMYAIMNHGYRKNDSERSSLKTCFDTFKLKIVQIVKITKWEHVNYAISTNSVETSILNVLQKYKNNYIMPNNFFFHRRVKFLPSGKLSSVFKQSKHI